MSDAAFKTCRRCGALTAIEEFYAHSAMPDGRANICKVCINASSRIYRNANREKIRISRRTPEAMERNRLHGKKFRQKKGSTLMSRIWRAKHPEKALAQRLVKDARRRGQLLRLPCEICGADQAQAHHFDYSRPLDVVWLCTQHHVDVHRKDEMRARVQQIIETKF